MKNSNDKKILWMQWQLKIKFQFINHSGVNIQFQSNGAQMLDIIYLVYKQQLVYIWICSSCKNSIVAPPSHLVLCSKAGSLHNLQLLRNFLVLTLYNSSPLTDLALWLWTQGRCLCCTVFYLWPYWCIITGCEAGVLWQALAEALSFPGAAPLTCREITPLFSVAWKRLYTDPAAPSSRKRTPVPK